ncbi:MAG: shikimate dehydrogenase [Nocardioides sp.]
MDEVRRCGVLGDPVAHSLSPVLHRAAYAATGLAWEYDAHRVATGGLAVFLAGLDPTWRGLSLTMPLKREAVALVDSLSETARLAGAANTLVLGEGVVEGDNTDVPGAEAALAERGVTSVRAATILGGGATATSAGLALVNRGAARLTLLVRDPDRAAATVAALRAHPATPEVGVDALGHGPVSGDVVVSTIPAAAQTEDLVARCAAVPAVFEVVYDPWPTPLAGAARRRGQVLVSGLDLLVHQAAAQFGLFTGLVAPIAVMREAGERALRDRSGR